MLTGIAGLLDGIWYPGLTADAYSRNAVLIYISIHGNISGIMGINLEVKFSLNVSKIYTEIKVWPINSKQLHYTNQQIKS